MATRWLLDAIRKPAPERRGAGRRLVRSGGCASEPNADPTWRPLAQGVLDGAFAAVLREAGFSADAIRSTDHDLARGAKQVMRNHGPKRDDRPDLRPRLRARLRPRLRTPDVPLIGPPTRLRGQSSVCRWQVERLDTISGPLNDTGHSIFPGKVGGAAVRGNVAGVKHIAMNVFSRAHPGCVIPAQACCGWIGKDAPGPGRGDDGAGFDHAFTQCDTTIVI